MKKKKHYSLKLFYKQYTQIQHQHQHTHKVVLCSNGRLLVWFETLRSTMSLRNMFLVRRLRSVDQVVSFASDFDSSITDSDFLRFNNYISWLRVRALQIVKCRKVGSFCDFAQLLNCFPTFSFPLTEHSRTMCSELFV